MKTYTVKNGDSLSLIAQNELHDITRWPEIAELNKITSVDLIYPGQTLTLPDAKKLPLIHPIEIGLLAAFAIGIGIVIYRYQKKKKAKE